MERSTDLCGDGAKLHEQDRFWWDFEPAGPLPGLQMVAGGACPWPGNRTGGWGSDGYDKIRRVFWSFF